ncbi:MAG TPA: efflux RND transporter periplasmic adaptor subunit [Holophagaceae bacterium]|nr:efflux RND transporter periplasmic adaptor subunit [Holophagaceae bacterium]
MNHTPNLISEDPAPIEKPGRVRNAMISGTALVVVLSLGLWAKTERSHHATALQATSKGVTVVPAKPAEYRPQHRYVGSLQAWNEAKVGPQFISAYITQVQVRPGDQVRRGQILATLEPERAQAQNEATKLQAEAIEAKLTAVKKESERILGLMKKGIVSVNEAENKLAEARSEEAKLGAAKSQLVSSNLEVQDSTLRAPFDGEVGERLLDPGAFVRPGTEIVSVVDRRSIRVSADAPESDFDLVAPGTPVLLKLLSDGRQLSAAVSRRSPTADPSTRTIHFELDLANQDRSIPAGTSAELLISKKDGEKALEVPAEAATVRGGKASVWTVEGGVARKHVLALLGEREGQLFLEPALPEGAVVVVDGRNQLQEGDKVVAKSQS